MTILGPKVQEQGLAQYSSITTGNQLTRTWIGELGSLQAIFLQETQFAESIRLDADGPTGTLVANYSRPAPGQVEIPQDTMELDCEELTQSIFVNAYFVGLHHDTIKEIRKQYEQHPDSNPNDTDGSYGAALTEINKVAGKYGPTEVVKADDAFQFLTLQNDSFYNYAFTLNWTRTVSRFYPTNIDLADMNAIFGTAKLVARTGNPKLFDVPPLTLTADDSAKGLVAGWRKRACKVSYLANGKMQLVQSWMLAKWNSKLYSNLIF